MLQDTAGTDPDPIWIKHSVNALTLSRFTLDRYNQKYNFNVKHYLRTRLDVPYVNDDDDLEVILFSPVVKSKTRAGN